MLRVSVGLIKKLISKLALGGSEQTWQDLTASRASGVTYTNTTGKPIQISLNTVGTGSIQRIISIFVDGVEIATPLLNTGVTFAQLNGQAIVPNGSTYSVVFVNLQDWYELR